MEEKIILKTFLSFLALTNYGLSAESGGMPQLNPEFWVSQIFWLVITFGFLLIILSKFILPKISQNLEIRKSQILENIETAEKQREKSEQKTKEFEKIIFDSQIEAKNIIKEAKKKTLEEINNKRVSFEEEISSEIQSVEDEIIELKRNSPYRIKMIALETSSDLIKQLIGSDVNKSNISAIVEDLTRKG